ncbi:MAG TPA: hypothetical protein VFN22_10535 [Gemmatimonadales bacterium]|nr:hypothetical protein [Gemmatimonadales bacterium]
MRHLPLAIATIGIILTGCNAGPPGDDAPAVRVSHVDGVTVVEHSPAALASVPQWRVGESLQSLGGLDADEDHDATAMRSAWLLDDGFIALNGRESRFRRFDSTGNLVAAFGRNGEGPDEFRALSVVRLPGDSLLIFDYVASTYRRLGPGLASVPGIVFRDQPSFDVGPFAVLPGGAVLGVATARDTSSAMDGPNFRQPTTLLRHDSGGSRWDSVFSYPGPLMYPVRGNEGGQDFPAHRFVTFGPSPLIRWWEEGIALATNDDWEIVVRDPHGTDVMRIRPTWPRRTVTSAMREGEIASDVAQLDQWQAPAAAKAPLLEVARSQRFTDSLAPYDRMLVGRDGRLWLRENVTAIDSSGTTWLAFGRDGSLVRRLLVPQGMLPLDVDQDRILIRRTDENDVGIIEIRRLKGDRP